MTRGLLYIFILNVTLLPGPAVATDEAERLCDPVTNVCYCTGGWDGAECAAMKPLCEPGFWRACSGKVCSCTRDTWQHDRADDKELWMNDLPDDRKLKP
ncbi:hypothetical protein [Roseovarius aestuarii]|uniref:EGF-like domain-containing protein n=1 Tax=Roseovarius aestuarii TaxID=475083 RepID=A0A1X7BMX8_9RHOB|nr:hypothetical protein [Roseovarius aestuarii]SMC10972.1 hypothetical protein ROA7745_00781 [Roseovarius aestuarii]